MASHAVDQGASRPLLTLGRVDRIRVQVGYRSRPDGAAYQQFLLDVPGTEAGTVDEPRILAALEPVLYAGADAPRHHSVHQHRWYTSWGASPGALEIGLLVTTGTRTPAVADAGQDGVVRAFRDLLELAGSPEPTATDRDAAVLRARRSAASAYGLDPDGLAVVAEQHHAVENSWTLGLRTPTGDTYGVVVGLVDGYAGSVRVRHDAPAEVFDSVGSE